jgi:hypothetical protein
MAANADFQAFHEGPRKWGANTLGSAIASRMFIGPPPCRLCLLSLPSPDPLGETPQRARPHADKLSCLLERNAGNRTVDGKADLLGCGIPAAPAFDFPKLGDSEFFTIIRDSNGALVVTPVPANQIDTNAIGYVVARNGSTPSDKLWFFSVTSGAADAFDRHRQCPRSFRSRGSKAFR